MDADDTGRADTGDHMHHHEDDGNRMETDNTDLNSTADHVEGQDFAHPMPNVSGQEMSTNSEAPRGTLEIRIKTLDSSTYTVRVEKDISVPALKQQLASVVGVAAENQRLICRGRVLKDDRLLSSYNVEDGHTLHMVARQMPRPDSTGVQGALDGSTTSTETRPPQVTHSVLVGTINVPDVGEGGVPDLNRIISAVLNSVGSGNATFGSGNSSLENVSVHGDGGDAPFVQAHTSAEGQARTVGGNVRQQFRLGGHPLSQEPPSLRSLEVSPDSLTTMSLYINRLEQVLSASGYGGDEIAGSLSGINPPQSSSHPQSSDRRDSSETARLPNSRESLMPAALRSLVRRVHDLLRNQAGAVLSSLASSLENESTLVDIDARLQVQSNAAWSGDILQQLGALLLELGRTTLTLRMGDSPADAVVNSGPALFISSVGLNTMMVQPSPLLPATLPVGAFPSGSAQLVSHGSLWPGAGLGPRSVNIHIHTSDLGGLLSSTSDGSPAHNQQASRNQQVSGGTLGTDGTRTPEQHLEAATGGSGVDAAERAPTSHDNDRATGSNGAQEGNSEPIVQLSPVQGTIMIMQENGAVRMLPMRTRTTGVGVRPANTTDASANRMLFHPLIPRFQQPSPFHISQSLRPPALGAFQQFQSRDPLPRSVNPQPNVPPAIVQLGRVSQALEPEVQPQGPPQNLAQIRGDQSLPQASEGYATLPPESLPAQSSDISLSLQQHDNTKTETQATSSGYPNTIEGQASKSTAINVWEQPPVGSIDIAKVVPETSVAEISNKNDQSTSIADRNASYGRDLTLSNHMEVEGEELLGEGLRATRGSASADTAQSDLACLLTLSNGLNHEIRPVGQEEEDNCEPNFSLKVQDRNGQIHPNNFEESESSSAKRRKLDSGSRAQAIGNTEGCDILSNKMLDNFES